MNDDPVTEPGKFTYFACRSSDRVRRRGWQAAWVRFSTPRGA